MENKIVNFLRKQRLEVVPNKTSWKVLCENIHAFSFTVGKRSFAVRANFTMFRDENIGSRRTLRVNKQREAFINSLKGTPAADSIDLSASVPVGTFATEEDFIRFMKDHRVVQLFFDYTAFREVNENFEVKEFAREDGIKIKYRGNIPTEEEIVRDVFIHHEYQRKGLTLEPTDVVLDLGGNIGAFTLDVAHRVKKVIAFEPEPVNYLFMEANVNNNSLSNAIIFQAAVVGNDDKTRDLYCGPVPYYYSFLVKNNRKPVPVECFNINDVVKKYRPTKMKVDIEGSEREVLMACRDFKTVREIIFEYNFDMNKDLKEGFVHFDALATHLHKHGFNVSEMKNYSRSSSWAEVFRVWK